MEVPSLNHIVSLSVRATGLTDKQPKKEVLVAVKALKHGLSKEQKDEFFREVSLMSILTHKHRSSFVIEWYSSSRVAVIKIKI